MGLETIAAAALSAAGAGGAALYSSNAQKKIAKQQQAAAASADASARADEEARQGRIKQGQGAIDSSFGNFNDGYYKGYQDKYTGYYYPELDKQYGQAKDKLTSYLAGQGILESGVGAQRLADLQQGYTDNRSRIANEAADASNALRGKVESAKTGLYQANQAAGDPTQIASQATGQATALSAPQSYSPLSDVFGSMLQNFGAYNNAKAYSTGSTGGGFTPDYTKSIASAITGNGNRQSSSYRVVS